MDDCYHAVVCFDVDLFWKKIAGCCVYGCGKDVVISMVWYFYGLWAYREYVTQRRLTVRSVRSLLGWDQPSFFPLPSSPALLILIPG